MSEAPVVDLESEEDDEIVANSEAVVASKKKKKNKKKKAASAADGFVSLFLKHILPVYPSFYPLYLWLQ